MLSPAQSSGLSLLLTCLLPFHPIFLSILVCYPLKQTTSFILQTLSLYCSLLSENSLFFSLASSLFCIANGKMNLSNSYLLSHSLLLSLPHRTSSLFMSIWELVMLVFLWDHSLIQLLALLIAIACYYYSMNSQNSQNSLSTLLPRLAITFVSLQACFQYTQLNITIILSTISFFILLQIRYPASSPLLLLLVSTLPLTTYSFSHTIVFSSVVITIIFTLGQNCIHHHRISSLLANFILLVSFLVLVTIYLYSSLSAASRLGIRDNILWKETTEISRFLFHSNQTKNVYLSAVFMNEEALCLTEEELYYYFLGHSYQYILKSPFDLPFSCPESNDLFHNLHTTLYF